ncbi:hypothetical protein EJB05_50563, partial [Eragrostis curvula]
MARSPSTLLPFRVTSTTSLRLPSNTILHCPSPPSLRHDGASGHRSSHTTTPSMMLPALHHLQVTFGPVRSPVYGLIRGAGSKTLGKSRSTVAPAPTNWSIASSAQYRFMPAPRRFSTAHSNSVSFAAGLFIREHAHFRPFGSVMKQPFSASS